VRARRWSLQSWLNFALNKILLLATVALLGKPGFNQLKQIVSGAIGQYAPPQEVGPTRYTIGLVLFVFPILIGWMTPYLGEGSALSPSPG